MIANRVGRRWHSPVIASITAVRPRPSPVRSALVNNPRNNVAAAKLMENENSPAIVAKILPP